MEKASAGFGVNLSNCKPESKITPRFLAWELRFNGRDPRVLIVVEEYSVGPEIRTAVFFWFGYRKLNIRDFMSSVQFRRELKLLRSQVSAVGTAGCHLCNNGRRSYIF